MGGGISGTIARPWAARDEERDRIYLGGSDGERGAAEYTRGESVDLPNLDTKCASERKNLHLRLRVLYSIPVLPTCGECEGSLASEMPPSGRRHGLKFGICAKLS